MILKVNFFIGSGANGKFRTYSPDYSININNNNILERIINSQVAFYNESGSIINSLFNISNIKISKIIFYPFMSDVSNFIIIEADNILINNIKDNNRIINLSISGNLKIKKQTNITQGLTTLESITTEIYNIDLNNIDNEINFQGDIDIFNSLVKDSNAKSINKDIISFLQRIQTNFKLLLVNK